MSKYVIALALLIACGSHEPKKAITQSVDSKLAEKSDKYKELLATHQDSDGFIMGETCDSTLFSGLISSIIPNVNIPAAMTQDPIQWHRSASHTCGPDNGSSRSTISRDMMLGVFYYLWYNKQLDLATELMVQLRNDNYRLRGEGTAGELVMTPAMMSTLAHIILKLGGVRFEAELAMPAAFGSDTGFVAHLTVWHILLRGELLGSIGDYNLSILKGHAERNPQNPLFVAAVAKYTTGDYSKAIALLLNEEEWPAEQLPTTNEHCSEWPIQRDYTEKDWGSCDGNVEHSGAELPLIYELIIK